MKFAKQLFTGALAMGAVAAAPASAAPIAGSFSLVSFGGSYVGGSALTATGLDFGNVFGSAGNGYGTNGTALIGNATGSFAGLDGTIGSISDISLGTFANAIPTNPFISFGANSPITVSFSNASVTRSPLGTSVTITGLASFANGVAADASQGMFSLAASSQSGSASSVNFTFTSNASTIAAAVPEPASWALMILGFGTVGFAMRSAKRRSDVKFDAKIKRLAAGLQA